MSTLDTRRDQMFPTLNAAQIATARPFASGPWTDHYNVNRPHAGIKGLTPGNE